MDLMSTSQSGFDEAPPVATTSGGEVPPMPGATGDIGPTPGATGDIAPTPPLPTPRRRVPRTRVGELWVAAVVFSLVLLLLLIFVLQNGQQAEVSFLGAHGHLPLGVALLLAAVFGVLLVALPGTARIVQLRLLDKRRRRHSQPPAA
jgi:uncharacterized integral membrane protein